MIFCNNRGPKLVNPINRNDWILLPMNATVPIDRVAV